MSDNQVIPEAAVDAAAKAHYGMAAVAVDRPWSGLAPMVRRIRLTKMRAALEAAAPHMQELQWGVRDLHSLMIAGHPSEESARTTAAEHPEWYEVVRRPMPGLWTTP